MGKAQGKSITRVVNQNVFPDIGGANDLAAGQGLCRQKVFLLTLADATAKL